VRRRLDTGGQRWPIAPDRIDMLAEANEVIRQLWTGDEVTFRGEHFTVENARLCDPPTQTIPIIVSAFAPHATKMAAASRDGLWTGGEAGPNMEARRRNRTGL
jgi:coenzyme F420-dependent glucose-6-phosphate dehydrogenase